jgi:hypothetical protein
MVKFYHHVDLRSKKAMIDYLTSHYRYPTMNGWNNSTSYACNLKVDRLGLDHDLVMKLYDLIGASGFYDPIEDLMQDFAEEHNFFWQAGFNGRSGGYLVLYQGGRVKDQHKSFCIECGQQNFQSITEGSNICGVCGQPSRVDYLRPPMRVVTYPGRETDQNEDFSDWDMYCLRERIKLVQSFDSLADAIVQEAIYIAKNYQLEEETYLIERTRQVLAPAT